MHNGNMEHLLGIYGIPKVYDSMKLVVLKLFVQCVGMCLTYLQAPVEFRRNTESPGAGCGCKSSKGF